MRLCDETLQSLDYLGDRQYPYEFEVKFLRRYYSVNSVCIELTQIPASRFTSLHAVSFSS